MKYKVFVWDFVKREGDLLWETDDFKEAKTHAYLEAIQYCEDENPIFCSVQKDVWAFTTSCDFGSIIKKVI